MDFDTQGTVFKEFRMKAGVKAAEYRFVTIVAGVEGEDDDAVALNYPIKTLTLDEDPVIFGIAGKLYTGMVILDSSDPFYQQTPYQGVAVTDTGFPEIVRDGIGMIVVNEAVVKGDYLIPVIGDAEAETNLTTAGRAAVGTATTGVAIALTAADAGAQCRCLVLGNKML